MNKSRRNLFVKQLKQIHDGMSGGIPNSKIDWKPISMTQIMLTILLNVQALVEKGAGETPMLISNQLMS